MNEVTLILSAVEQGDPQAAEQLLTLVYNELRRLAAQKLSHEKPGQTLDATALVHEAYLRLVAVQDDGGQRNAGTAGDISSRLRPKRCGEFSSKMPAAKGRKKHGGDLNRVELGESDLATTTSDERLVGDRRSPRKAGRGRPTGRGTSQTAILCRILDFRGRGDPRNVPHKCLRAVGLRSGLAAVRSRRPGIESRPT